MYTTSPCMLFPHVYKFPVYASSPCVLALSFTTLLHYGMICQSGLFNIILFFLVFMMSSICLNLQHVFIAKEYESNFRILIQGVQNFSQGVRCKITLSVLVSKWLITDYGLKCSSSTQTWSWCCSRFISIF